MMTLFQIYCSSRAERIVNIGVSLWRDYKQENSYAGFYTILYKATKSSGKRAVFNNKNSVFSRDDTAEKKQLKRPKK